MTTTIERALGEAARQAAAPTTPQVDRRRGGRGRVPKQLLGLASSFAPAAERTRDPRKPERDARWAARHAAGQARRAAKVARREQRRTARRSAR